MRSYFDNGQMKLTWCEGNVLVNYYPFDSDSLMIGMNHLETTHLKLFMNDEGKLARIWAAAGSGTLHPLALIPKKDRYLEKFQWFDYIRPLNKDDIFHWRGKRAGSELKKSVRRQAPPKQKIKK